MTLAVFLATPAPIHLRSRVHPLRSLVSSSEYVAVSNLLAGRNQLAPSLGFCSFFATPVQGVYLPTELPPSVYVPPTVFLTLPTAYSSLYLAGLFHPARHVQGSPYRGFPRRSADLTHRQPVLSWPLTSCPFAPELPRLHQRLKLGLQSFDPSVDPLTLTGVLRLPASRSPLELSDPAGFRRTPW
jgi:hypothetical protein